MHLLRTLRAHLLASLAAFLIGLGSSTIAADRPNTLFIMSDGRTTQALACMAVGWRR